MAGEAKAAVLRKERRVVVDGVMVSEGDGLLKIGDVAGIPCGHGEQAFGAEGNAGGIAGCFKEAEDFSIEGDDANAVLRADPELALRGQGEAVEAFFALLTGELGLGVSGVWEEFFFLARRRF